MSFEVQDGRFQKHKSSSLPRSENSNSVLLQALETNDADLLDWCVENNEPPKEISLAPLAHLLNFLGARYWVYSNPKALNWIQYLLSINALKMQRAQEFDEILEDLKKKLQAKTQGINALARIKSSLEMVNADKASEGFTFIREPRVVINEEAE